MKNKLVLYGTGMALSIGLIIAAEILAETKAISLTVSAVLVTIFVIALLVVSVAFAKVDCAMSKFECRKCGHIFKTTFGEYLWGAHTPKTRYLKCPGCGKKSWCKRHSATKTQ